MTGEVRMRLSKGRAVAVGRRSPHELYDHALATYGEGDAFKHGSAPGFIDIFGLSARTAAQVERTAGKGSETAQSASVEVRSRAK